jgi:chromate transport protein ChrA
MANGPRPSKGEGANIVTIATVGGTVVVVVGTARFVRAWSDLPVVYDLIFRVGGVGLTLAILLALLLWAVRRRAGADGYPTHGGDPGVGDWIDEWHPA